MGDTVGLRYTGQKISAISNLFGSFSLLARLDEVQEELLFYPGACRHQQNVKVFTLKFFK